MRFMKIEGKVRLKNFEHIVDLIEQDGGEVSVSEYLGNGKAKPNGSALKIRRPRLTASKVQSIKSAAKRHPNWTKTRIAKHCRVSGPTVSRALSGKYDNID